MTELVFYLFAGLLIFSSAMVVVARNTVHCVLFLIFSFFNAAGLFILLQAEFLAMILLIVYVGAVAVLFLFAVMMLDVNSREMRPFWGKEFLKRSVIKFFRFLGFSLLLFFLTILCYWLMSAIGNLGFHLHWWSFDLWDGYLPRAFSEMIGGQSDAMSLDVIVSYGLLLASLGWGHKTAKKILKYAFLEEVSQLVSLPPVVVLLSCLLLGFLGRVQSHFAFHPMAEHLKLAPIPRGITNTEAIGQVLYTTYFLPFQIAGFILLIAMIGAIVLTARSRDQVRRQAIKNQLNRRKEETIELKKMPIGKGVS